MHHRITRWSLALALVFCAMPTVGASHVAFAQDAPLSFDFPNHIQFLAPGQDLDVTVIVGSEKLPLDELFGLGFEVRYDPDLFEAELVDPGEGLPEGALTFSSIDNVAGVVAFSATARRGQPASSYTAVEWTYIKFKVIGDPDEDVMTSFSYKNVSAINAGGESLDVDLKPGKVKVVANGLQVFAGDLDNSGVVDETDVFALATYYGATGPERFDGGDGPDYFDLVSRTASYAKRGLVTEPMGVAPTWTPPQATYADGDGDGDVDQNDLMPIGVNFGLVTEPLGIVSTAYSKSVASVEIAPQPVGTVVTLVLESDVPLDDVRGISARLALPAGLFAAETTVTPANWLDGNGLLAFDTLLEDGTLATAFARPHGLESVSGAGTLIEMRLEVAQPMTEAVRANLLRAVLLTGSGAEETGALTLRGGHVSTANEAETPASEGFAARGAYPNPSAGTTTLALDLPEAAAVNIAVYDLTGREVLRTEIEQMAAGQSRGLRVDAASLPSGMYMYRVVARGRAMHTASGTFTIVR